MAVKQSLFRFTPFRWNGKFENYYSKDGATFVDVENNQIKTSFKNEEFDENAKDILEVVRKHVDD